MAVSEPEPDSDPEHEDDDRGDPQRRERRSRCPQDQHRHRQLEEPASVDHDLLEGHESARTRGQVIGSAGITDDAMLAVALHLRGQELSLRDIATGLVISTGEKKASTPTRRP